MRRRPLTRPFSVQQTVQAELYGHTTLDQTPFGLASGVPRESPRCSCAWREMLCLGYASSGEEGIVSEDISRSRRLIQTRWRAFWCPCVGAMLPRGCGLCVEGQAVEVALDCGQENYGPGWSCGVGVEEVPGRDPWRALWRWPRWLCCRSCEGASVAPGEGSSRLLWGPEG